MADGFADQNEQRTPQAPKEAKSAIPQTVSNRMARRIAISTGIPTIMGMGVFVASYLLISQKILRGDVFYWA